MNTMYIWIVEVKFDSLSNWKPTPGYVYYTRKAAREAIEKLLASVESEMPKYETKFRAMRYKRDE